MYTNDRSISYQPVIPMAKKGLLTSLVPTTVKSEELVKKRREQITLAAIKLFSRKGFHKTTLRDLAEEAGISHGNIYDYVGSKENIFFLLHEFMIALVDSALIESVENITDPIEKLRRMVRSEFNVMYEWADAILIIYQESHILKKTGLMKEFLLTEREHIRRFEHVIQECLEKGNCKHVNPRVVANLIKIMADSWVLKRWDLRGHVTQLEMEQSILDLVFSGLFSQQGSQRTLEQSSSGLGGRLALVVNAATLVGSAISSFLLAKGAVVAELTWEEGQGGQVTVIQPGDEAEENVILGKMDSDFSDGIVLERI